MAFSEVREYRLGDDIRDIDWNVTARTSNPHIKVFEEERELTLMLLVDVSGSRMFGTRERLKKSLATEMAAVLAFSAAQNNDKIGCIFFSDKIEKYVPPKKGKQHVLRIISDLVDFKPESTGTDLGLALKFFSNVIKKRCTAFVISDFMDVTADKANFEDALKIAASKHDVVGLRLYDEREAELPNVGIIELKDAESGEKQWVDTASRRVREDYHRNWQHRSAVIDNVLTKNRVDSVNVATDQDYVIALMRLFKMR
ncbi:hypothetical protein BN938_0152 [Mucinivorans hirudinis]|uniref:DUF58 domain-containing protein n=1 Tax=Mucinivorans hirudinis TaxID=1433126 RepID=A0A060R940_9BACT|nr:hypothetical protein BN938_0152 [Mucinivorans hirudinis]